VGGVHLLVRAQPEIFQEVLWTNLLSLVQSRGIDMISPGINCHKMEGDTPEAVNPKFASTTFLSGPVVPDKPMNACRRAMIKSDLDNRTIPIVCIHRDDG
jgi:hypothetical protein